MPLSCFNIPYFQDFFIFSIRFYAFLVRQIADLLFQQNLNLYLLVNYLIFLILFIVIVIATACCSVAKSCLTLLNLMDCSPASSSVHRISQARILEWVAISFSMGSSWPKDQTHVSCIAGKFFTAEPPENHDYFVQLFIFQLFWFSIFAVSLLFPF